MPHEGFSMYNKLYKGIFLEIFYILFSTVSIILALVWGKFHPLFVYVYNNT